MARGTMANIPSDTEKQAPSEIVALLARAMHEWNWELQFTMNPERPRTKAPKMLPVWLSAGRTVVAALGEAGYVIVPRGPTKELAGDG